MLGPRVPKARTSTADMPTGTLAPLSRRATSLAGNEAHGHNHQEAHATPLTSHGATAGGAWDFSKIPVFPPDQAAPPQPVSALAVAPLSGAMQGKLTVGGVSDPLEHEADHVAEQVTAPDAMAGATPRTAHVAPAAVQRLAVTESSGGQAGGQGTGEALDRAIRAHMEPRFGHDFSGVRVHTDAEAARSARSFGALAYTLGQNIVFADGQYAPDTSDGERLLAHELTHVVQQRHAEDGAHSPQLKAAATRFQDEPTLEAISEGRAVLKEGDKGEAVIRVTTALSELGHYPISIIDENFDPPLTSAVAGYQNSKGLTGKVPAGTVEKQTFDKLDQDFSAGYRVERGVLARQKSPDILKETQSLDPAERTASARAVSTEPPVNPITGLPPTFRADVPGKGNYAVRLRAAVDNEIVSEWTNMAQGKTAARARPGSLYDAPTVDAIAAQSEVAVRAVFGEYITGRAIPSLKMGVSVGDAWKFKEDTFTAGGRAQEDRAVAWRVQKILDGDDAVKLLDREHGAIQSRAAEQVIVSKIHADMMVKYRAKLLELHKAWPGFEDAGVVYVQLFKGASPAEQRAERWRFFQTFMHEFIHALEHPDYARYRSGLSDQKGGFTLREGTTDYFTKVVWSSLTIDDALRARIEGPVHDPVNKLAIPPLNTYGEAENAERLAGVVGIRNVAAAFFLGKVNLVGKP